MVPVEARIGTEKHRCPPHVGGGQRDHFAVTEQAGRGARGPSEGQGPATSGDKAASAVSAVNADAGRRTPPIPLGTGSSELRGAATGRDGRLPLWVEHLVGATRDSPARRHAGLPHLDIDPGPVAIEDYCAAGAGTVRRALSTAPFGSEGKRKPIERTPPPRLEPASEGGQDRVVLVTRGAPSRGRSAAPTEPLMRGDRLRRRVILHQVDAGAGRA